MGVWVRDRYGGCGDEGGEEEKGENEIVGEHHGSWGYAIVAVFL